MNRQIQWLHEFVFTPPSDKTGKFGLLPCLGIQHLPSISATMSCLQLFMLVTWVLVSPLAFDFVKFLIRNYSIGYDDLFIFHDILFIHSLSAAGCGGMYEAPGFLGESEKIEKNPIVYRIAVSNCALSASHPVLGIRSKRLQKYSHYVWHIYCPVPLETEKYNKEIIFESIANTDMKPEDTLDISLSGISDYEIV